MRILAYYPDELTQLVQEQVATVEEMDLETGHYHLVYGDSLSSVPPTTTFSINLTPDMAVGRLVMSSHSTTQAGLLANALSLLYQRNWTAILMDCTLRPLNFELDAPKYYDEIVGRILEAMNARYVIVRLKKEFDDEKYLECVAVKDRLNQLPRNAGDFDIPPEHLSSLIYKRIESDFANAVGYVHVLHRNDYPSVFSSMSQDGTAAIETIIVSPLTSGDDIRGFINVGYNFYLELNYYIKGIFATAFNHLSIAMENHRRMNELSSLRDSRTREFIERFHLDLLQGLRHTGYNALMSADIYRERMTRFYAFKGDPKNDPALALERSHLDIELAFDNMASLREFSERKASVDLLSVFEGAKALLRVELEAEDVKIRTVSPVGSIVAFVNEDAVRSAFANLLLNSLQAMKDANLRKSDRKVTVTFRRDRQTIIIDFSDDGPGVRLGGNIRQISDIWLPGKSSKKEGTGYGLPMVREVFEHIHRGSVDLRPSTRGAHFRIMLVEGSADEDGRR